MRVRGAIAATAGDWRQGAEEQSLHGRRRPPKLDDVAEVARCQCELQRVRHPLRVGVAEAGEPEHGLDHVPEALARVRR
jgi:hypothetical protein